MFLNVSYVMSGRVGSVRVAGPALRWRGQESGGRRLRHGQEVAVEAHEGDPHAPGRVRVHQDARLP